MRGVTPKKNRAFLKKSLTTSAALAAAAGAAPALAVDLDAGSVSVVGGVDFHRATNVVSFAIDAATNTINVELDNGTVESFADGAFAVIGDQLFLDPDAMSLLPATVTSLTLSPAGSGVGIGLAALLFSGGGSAEAEEEAASVVAEGEEEEDANQPPAFDLETFTWTSSDRADDIPDGEFFPVIQFAATDADGDTLEYSILDDAGLVLEIDNETGEITLVGMPFPPVGPYEVEIQVSDGTATDTMTLIVEL